MPRHGAEPTRAVNFTIVALTHRLVDTTAQMTTKPPQATAEPPTSKYKILITGRDESFSLPGFSITVDQTQQSAGAETQDGSEEVLMREPRLERW